MNVSIMICAPLKKSPNCASQMNKCLGLSMLIPYSNPRTASSDKWLLASWPKNRLRKRITMLAILYHVFYQVKKRVKFNYALLNVYKNLFIHSFEYKCRKEIQMLLPKKDQHTSRNVVWLSARWLRGIYMSLVSWSINIACLWEKVPLPTSCPLMRTL